MRDGEQGEHADLGDGAWPRTTTRTRTTTDRCACSSSKTIPLLGDALQAGLRGKGFAVEWLRDGEAGAAALATDRFDAVVLDLGLPRLDGRRCSNGVAARAIARPCWCSPRATRWRTASAGLDDGADDYVVKPVAIAELAARLRALVRRASGIARGQLEAGPLAARSGDAAP